MPLKGLTGDLFIVDTETGKWNKLPTLEEVKLSEPSKEEIDKVFNKSPETFDFKILNTTGFYIAMVYGNSTYLRFPKKLKRSRKYRKIQKWFRWAADYKRRTRNIKRDFDNTFLRQVYGKWEGDEDEQKQNS